MSAAGPQRRHRGLSSASGSPGIRCSQDRRSLGPQRLGTRVLCTCEDALRFLDEGTHLVGTEPFPVPRTQIPRPSDRGRPARMTASPGEVRKHAVRPTPATARLAIPSLLRESTRPTRPPRPPRSAPGPARRLPERSASTSASGSRWRRRRQQVLGSGSGFLRGGDAADEVTPVGGARPGAGPRSSWGWGEPRAAPPHHAPQPLRPEPEGRSPKLSSFQTPGAPSARRPGDGGDGAGQGQPPVTRIGAAARLAAGAPPACPGASPGTALVSRPRGLLGSLWGQSLVATVLLALSERPVAGSQPLPRAQEWPLEVRRLSLASRPASREGVLAPAGRLCSALAPTPV